MVEIAAFIGLGANLGDPPAQLREAVVRLGRAPGTRVVRVAPLYGSSPLGPADQPDYANTVAEVATVLAPEVLLGELQRIEDDLGRVRSIRWGPRVIDLDLLLYGDRVMVTPSLVLPHPGVTTRRFVLAPLADLAPELVIPGTHVPVHRHLAALTDDPGTVWRSRAR